MKCPKCAVEMEQREVRGVVIDVCPTCQGVLLDKGESETIDELDLGATIEGGEKAEVTGDTRPAHCYACDNAMMTLTGAGDVDFDWCDQCERIFFDRGELTAFDAFSES